MLNLKKLNSLKMEIIGLNKSGYSIKQIANLIKSQEKN